MVKVEYLRRGVRLKEHTVPRYAEYSSLGIRIGFDGHMEPMKSTSCLFTDYLWYPNDCMLLFMFRSRYLLCNQISLLYYFAHERKLPGMFS